MAYLSHLRPVLPPGPAWRAPSRPHLSLKFYFKFHPAVSPPSPLHGARRCCAPLGECGVFFEHPPGGTVVGGSMERVSCHVVPGPASKAERKHGLLSDKTAVCHLWQGLTCSSKAMSSEARRMLQTKTAEAVGCSRARLLEARCSGKTTEAGGCSRQCWVGCKINHSKNLPHPGSEPRSLHMCFLHLPGGVAQAR